MTVVIKNRKEYLEISKKEKSQCLTISEFLKKNDSVKVSFFFQGVEKIFDGFVAETKRTWNAIFITIKDPEKKFKTVLGNSFEYVLSIYNEENVSLIVKDGAIREVPFIITT